MTQTDYWLIGVFMACVVVASVDYLPYSAWLTVLSVLVGGVISGGIS